MVQINSNILFLDTEISHSFPSQYTHTQIIVLAIVITLMMVVVVVGNMLVIIAIAILCCIFVRCKKTKSGPEVGICCL